MKKYLFLLALGLGLTACSDFESTRVETRTVFVPIEVTVPTPSPVVDPVQADINSVVADENAYRLGLGQTMLSGGLSCSVQALGSGQWLSSSSPGYNAGHGVVAALPGALSYSYLLTTEINQPDSVANMPNAVIPTAIQSLFLNNNYRISCSGQLVVLETGYYNFSLASDDGSILTVDGTQVINNDGSHGVTTKTGVKFLRRGVRSFSLLYAQSGAGRFALVLKSGGLVIPPAHFVH